MKNTKSFYRELLNPSSFKSRKVQWEYQIILIPYTRIKKVAQSIA